MYIGFKELAVTLSMIEKSRYRIRRCIDDISDYKSRGVNTSNYNDYIRVTYKESHVIDFIKRKL